MSWELRRSLFIPRPRDEVFAFFSDALNLERITPEFLRFRVLTPAPIAVHPGTIIDYELRLYGVRFRWKTRIEAFDPPTTFVDTQVRGPYKLWRHTHEFEEVPGGTEMRDRVEYDLPSGPVGRLARAIFVRRSVEEIFDHRNKTILEIMTPERRG